VFRGPIEAVERAFLDGRGQGPNLWWPEDWARVVATDVYASATYVAGSRGLIDDLLASEHAAALVSPTDPLH
jgi:hypothetical protein